MRRFGLARAMHFAVMLAGMMGATTMAAQAADPSLSPAANKAFMDDFAKQRGAVKRPSGLEYRIIRNGFGATPAADDTVTVYYKGKLVNGKVFDATEPGFPAQFQVSGVIPGWTEALELMREGDEWELVIPSSLAYGIRGAGDAIPPNQTLDFDVTLVKVTKATRHPDQGDSDQSQQ